MVRAEEQANRPVSHLTRSFSSTFSRRRSSASGPPSCWASRRGRWTTAPPGPRSSLSWCAPAPRARRRPPSSASAPLARGEPQTDRPPWYGTQRSLLLCTRHLLLLTQQIWKVGLSYSRVTLGQQAEQSEALGTEPNLSKTWLTEQSPSGAVANKGPRKVTKLNLI